MTTLDNSGAYDTDRITVVIADDHDIVRQGIRSLLGTIADIDVVAEACTGDDAVSISTELMPDVLLLDLQMPGGHGLEATRQITAALPSVAVVILTMYEDADSIDAALRAGARGYLLKGAPQDDVVHAIRAAARGHVILGPGAAERLLERLSSPSAGTAVFPQLTDRERDVLRHVASGQNNATIARALHLAPKTVANHVSNILTKLQIADRAAAIVAARRAGLADGPDRA